MEARATIRPEQPADKASVRRVVETAFQGQGAVVADLVDALARHVELSLVAEVDGAVVGHVQLNRSWVDARQRLVDVLVLSPRAVLPDHERRGIGSALVARALELANEGGWPAMFLEGSPDYYGKRGFARASARGFTPPSTRIPDAACQVVVLDAHEEWMTGALVYCDPFWELDCVGLRDPLLSELEARFG
jgi:putative acetyltransferase